MSISHEAATRNLAIYAAKKKREHRKAKREARLIAEKQQQHAERANLASMFTIAARIPAKTCALLCKVPVKKFSELQKAA